MRTRLSFALAGIFLAGVVLAQEKPKPADPGKDDFDSLLSALTKTLGELGEALGKVTDEKSCREATPNLEKLAKSLSELSERAQKLGRPSGDEEKTLKAKYETDLTAASKKLTAEIERLNGQPYGKAALATLKSKPKSADKPK
jgi:ABC-type transporter Mla subunit MlaD